MMNENLDTNIEKIADYLGNSMSPSEETAFMEELGRDETLRRLYEEELLVRQILQEHNSATTLVLHPASAPRPIPMISPLRLRTIAAACLIIIIGSVCLARLTADHSPDIVITAPALSETLSGPADHTHTIPIPDTLFAKYYTFYDGDNDPVEISMYYQSYRKHDYAAVLAAHKEDYLLMGTDTKNRRLDQYMQLYKGLAYLSAQQPVQATQKFDFLLRSARPPEAVFYAAQWYNTLSWLKRKDISKDSVLAKATRSADLITHTSSPYKQKAISLLGSLQSNRP